MGVVDIKNSVTFKTRFAGKQICSQKIRLIVDRFEWPTDKTVARECNRLVAMFAPDEHHRGATFAECDIPQTEKTKIHEQLPCIC
jgi:hypothetical protein